MAVAVPAVADSADTQYRLAAGYYERADWNNAFQELRAFTQQYPDHPSAPVARFLIGEALVQLGKYGDARPAFAEFLQQNPDHRYASQALFRMGETAYLSGDLEQARGDLKKFDKLYPDHPYARYALPYLGEIALAVRDGQDAQAVYDQALQRFPDGPMADECRFGLGRSFELLGDDEQAHRFYTFLAENPAGVLADNASLQQARLHYQRKQFAEAERILVSFAKSYPRSELTIDARYWLGMAQSAQENWAEASRTLVGASQSAGDHPLAAAVEFAAAEALRKDNQPDTARDHYERVLSKWPASQWADDALQTRIQLALLADQHEQVDALSAEFEERFADSPLQPFVQESLGRSLLQREQYAGASAAFKSLTETEGDAAASAAHLYLLGLAQLGAKQYEAAIQSLDRIGSVEDNEIRAAAHLARASAYTGLREFEKAADAQRAYLQIQPSGSAADECRAQLVASLAHAGKLDDAHAALQELESRAPADGLLQSTYILAEAAFDAQRFELAKQLFTRLAADGNPKEFVQKGLSGLGWTLAKSGNAEQAAEIFARLKRADGDIPQMAEAAIMNANQLETAGKTSEALTAYHSVIENFPQSKYAVPAMIAAARLHEGLGTVEDRTEAAVLLGRIAGEDPPPANLDAVLYQWAWILVDLKRPAEADAIFERVRSEHADSQYWADATYRLAERAARSGDRARADELAEQLIASKTSGDVLCHALYLKGQSAAAENRWSDAISLMNRVVTEYPDSALQLPAQYWVAEAHYRLSEMDKARGHFDRLATLAAGRTETWLAMVPLRQAQMLALNDNWQEAFDLAAGIATRFPDFQQQYEADYLLGRYYANHARFTDAREAYERVIRSTTGGRTETAAMAQWMIGETHFHQKNYDEAIKAFHRVEILFAYPDWQAAAMLQAGKCYEQKAQWELAIKVYAQLLKEYPRSPHADDAAQRLRIAQQNKSGAASRQ